MVSFAIAWYTPESLEQLRAVSEDHVGTYEDVSRLTEEIDRRLREGLASGARRFSSTSLRWCTGAGITVTGWIARRVRPTARLPCACTHRCRPGAAHDRRRLRPCR